MNLVIILISLIFYSVVLKADEIILPGIAPAAVSLPLGTNLVDKKNQQHDADSLQRISNVLDRALSKHDPKQDDLSKNKKLKKTKEDSIPKKNLDKKNDLYRFNSEGLLHSAMTEFLRSDELKKLVTIKLKKIDIRDVFWLLSKEVGVSFLLDGDVKESIPGIEVEALPVGAIIQMLLDAHKPQLALIKIGGAWRVMLKTRALEHLESIIKAEVALDSIVDFLCIKNAVWNEKFKLTAQEIWKGIVGLEKNKTQTYLVFDDSTNQLIFSARAMQVKKFKELISSLDTAAPQVRLEMRIVCAGKNFESDLGLEWSGLYDRRYWAGKFGLAGLGLGSIQPVARAGASINPVEAGDTFKNLLGWVLNAIPVNLATKTSQAVSASFPITFGGKNLEWGRLNLRLMAAEQNSEIKTILKPVLLVNNQETAEILVGQQLPHKVKVEEAVQGNLVNASSTAYKDIGTKIQVKPSAMLQAGQVGLDIYLEHTYVTNLQKILADDRGSYSYSIETARTRNKIVLKSGQTSMIGGLMVNTYEQAESGIPFLKDIPILGLLFRGRSKVLVEKQLLIFITPSLISEKSHSA